MLSSKIKDGSEVPTAEDLTEGQIYLSDVDITDRKVNINIHRQKVGMVFQYPEHQLFETTNFEDVCLHLEIVKQTLEK